MWPFEPALLRVACQFWAPQLKRNIEVLEHPEKSSGAGENLEHKSYDELLRELGLFSLDKRR